MKNNPKKNLKTFLIANKCDLKESQVTPDEVQNLKQEFGIDLFLETSALNGENINKVIIFKNRY